MKSAGLPLLGEEEAALDALVREGTVGDERDAKTEYDFQSALMEVLDETFRIGIELGIPQPEARGRVKPRIVPGPESGTDDHPSQRKARDRDSAIRSRSLSAWLVSQASAPHASQPTPNHSYFGG